MRGSTYSLNFPPEVTVIEKLNRRKEESRARREIKKREERREKRNRGKVNRGERREKKKRDEITQKGGKNKEGNNTYENPECQVNRLSAKSPKSL